ncbi:MAG: class I SAM-dependent methyltransferase [Gemmatimonadaceae bacterium]
MLPADAAFDRGLLALHLERYKLAAEYVRDADVVDCACGTGFGSEVLLQAGARSVQGVELDRAALEYARSRHAHDGIRYYEADALRFAPTPQPSVWVSLETVEHLPNPTAYVARVAQVLPKGGRFIASVPVTVSTDGNPHHLHDFTRASFRRLLTANGFREIRAVEQSLRFTLSDLFGRSRRGRRRDRRHGLLRWYARHPRVLAKRVQLTLTKGFVNEYLTIVAELR